jgi:hypothetical protein
MAVFSCFYGEQLEAAAVIGEQNVNIFITVMPHGGIRGFVWQIAAPSAPLSQQLLRQ